MPIPKPRKNESRDTFISRCMGDSVMNREYSDSKQRHAVCTSSWVRTRRGGGKWRNGSKK